MIIRSKTSLGDIEIDATLKIMHRVQAMISTSPLEDGSDVTDHVRVLPQGVEVVGIIVPTHPSGQIRDLATLAGGLGGFASAFGFDGTRDIEAWQGLKALIKRRRLIEIVTRYDVYRVLPMELIADEDAGFGLALQFTMRFQQIQIGSVRSSDQVAEELRDTVGGKVGGDNLGQQTLGQEEAVPIGKAKVKPRIQNPYTAAYEVAA